MALVEDFVQEVLVAGGFCCVWVGPDRSSAQLFSVALFGAVPEAGNHGAAVALVVNAQLCQLKVKVTTDDASGSVTKISCKRTTVELLAVADDYPYAPRNHNHGDLYSLAGHNHDGRYSQLGHLHAEYSPVGHPHPEFSLATHSHDHDLLPNRLPKDHTLAIETRLVRQVPTGAPLQVLVATDAEFAGLRAELGGSSPLRDAYIARNGVSSVSAMVMEFGAITRVLSGIMVRDTAAADLRWTLRLYYTGSEAEYSRPSGSSTEDLHLFVTTHLNAD